MFLTWFPTRARVDRSWFCNSIIAEKFRFQIGWTLLKFWNFAVALIYVIVYIVYLFRFSYPFNNTKSYNLHWNSEIHHNCMQMQSGSLGNVIDTFKSLGKPFESFQMCASICPNFEQCISQSLKVYKVNMCLYWQPNWTVWSLTKYAQLDIFGLCMLSSIQLLLYVLSGNKSKCHLVI